MAFEFGRPVPNSAQLAEEIQNNLDALGTTNATADPTKPKRPKNGMLRILASNPDNIQLQYFWGSWRTIFDHLGEGSGNTRRYEAIISAPIPVWTIEHGLGLYPLVQCINLSGQIIVPLDIQHTTYNRVVITHSAAYSGRAILIG
jgi:hypothetical protein